MLYAGTCGCVGLLKRWLESAWIAVEGSKQIVDLKILESTRYPNGSLIQWQAEITHGHEKLRLFFDGVSSN